MTLHDCEDRWIAIVAECQTLPGLEDATRRAAIKRALTPRLIDAITARAEVLAAEPPPPWTVEMMDREFAATETNP